MRQGQQNRRNRGRSSRGRGSNPLSRNYESNGPDVKIKGTAAHVAEKYTALARDALSSGSTVTAEAYFQHAEHYNRIIMAAQAKQEEASQSSGRSRSPDRKERADRSERNRGERNRGEQDKNGGVSHNNGAHNNAANATDARGNSIEMVIENIPGTGEQPPLNADAAPVIKDSSELPKADKPKTRRAPRPRKPRPLKAEKFTEKAVEKPAEKTAESKVEAPAKKAVKVEKPEADASPDTKENDVVA